MRNYLKIKCVMLPRFLKKAKPTKQAPNAARAPNMYSGAGINVPITQVPVLVPPEVSAQVPTMEPSFPTVPVRVTVSPPLLQKITIVSPFIEPPVTSKYDWPLLPPAKSREPPDMMFSV
jgi:hypothetical protein